MHAYENYKTYGTVEDGIAWEVAEQPLLEQIPPPSIQPTSHRQLGRLLSVGCGMPRYVFIGVCRLSGRVLSVACGMFRFVFYGCVSVAWEIAANSLWSVIV